MRLRNVPHATEKLMVSPCFIEKPEELKGRWHTYFNNNNPLFLEIGSGKGRFITTLARENPDKNYIAMEKYPSVLLKLIGKIPDGGLSNLAVISVDAENLESFFEQGEVQGLYLNFSDPWPKKKHAKRRLTAPGFLSLYEKVLKPKALLEFKTDNPCLFQYSLETLAQSALTIEDSSFDLYESHLLVGNVATEYEEKFHLQGKPIFKLIARLDKKRAVTATDNVQELNPLE